MEARAGRLVRRGHRGGGRGGRRLGQADQMDAGARPPHRQPGRASRAAPPTRVAVHDDHRVRARVRAGRVGHPGAVEVRPAGTERALVQAAHQLGRAGGGLLPVVGEEEPAVLAVHRAQMRQPAQPGPLGRRSSEGAGRGPRGSARSPGRRGSAARRAAPPPRGPAPPAARAVRPAPANRPRAAPPSPARGQQPEPSGGRSAVPSRTTSASGWPVVALPQPGPGAQRGQQHGRRVRPGLGRGRHGGEGGEGRRRGRRGGAGRRRRTGEPGRRRPRCRRGSEPGPRGVTGWAAPASGHGPGPAARRPRLLAPWCRHRP